MTVDDCAENALELSIRATLKTMYYYRAQDPKLLSDLIRKFVK